MKSNQFSIGVFCDLSRYKTNLLFFFQSVCFLQRFNHTHGPQQVHFLKNWPILPTASNFGHVWSRLTSPTGSFFKKIVKFCPQQVISAMSGHVASPTAAFLIFLTTFGPFYLFPQKVILEKTHFHNF